MRTDYYTAVHWLNNNLILCNEIVNIDPSVWDEMEYPNKTEDNDEDEEQELPEIFQWYLTDMSRDDHDWMQENFPDLIFSYSEMLDLYILCVDHFGTMWKGVPTDTNCENAAKASQLTSLD